MGYEFKGYEFIDPAGLMATVGGDREAYRALARIYLDTTPGLHTRLQAALQAGDCRTAYQASHALRTSVLLMGARELGDVLHALERFADDGEQAVLPLAQAEVARLFFLVETEVRASLAPGATT